MRFAVHNLHVPAVAVDEDGSYAIVEDGPRFVVTPLDTGTGPAIFPEFDEAETWRKARLAEVMETMKA